MATAQIRYKEGYKVMKDVISVDDLLMGIFNVYYSEYDGRYHNGRQADGVVPYEDVKPKLYSLLISKLPDTPENKAVLDGLFNEV